MNESLTTSILFTPTWTANMSSTTPNVPTSPEKILLILIGLLAAVLNGILLIAIVRNASSIFKHIGAYLVANVAVADLLTGVFSMVYGIVQTSQLSKTEHQVLLALFWTSVEASLVTVFVMSLIRYIAIVYPFKTETWLTKTTAYCSCIFVWSFSLFCGILMAFYTEIMKFCLGVFFEITTIATAFLYYKIFKILGQRMRHLPLTPMSKRLDKDLQREYQLTTVVVALTLIMVVTVLPHMIGGQIYLGYKFFSSSEGPNNVKLFATYYLPVELTNFVLNPIVYAWRLPKYRQALLRTLRCC